LSSSQKFCPSIVICKKMSFDGIFETLSKILPQLIVKRGKWNFYYDKTELHRSAYVSPLKRESGLT